MISYEDYGNMILISVSKYSRYCCSTTFYVFFSKFLYFFV